MKVTELHISARQSSGNRRPSFGWAVFDDGRSFYWGVVIDRNPLTGAWEETEHYDFVGRRSTHQGAGSTQFNFKSPKREAALIRALNR